MFSNASTWAVVLRFVTFEVFDILVDSAMNSMLRCSDWKQAGVAGV
jgi:hypothetical protein